MIDRAGAAPRILIVDDEPHNRRLLEVMLAPEGFCVETAANGPDALARVAARAPDLILLDVMMPGMDGYAVATQLKGNVATRSIPIIMATVCDDREAKMRGLRTGAEDFLSKPVDRAELCVRVRNLLRLKAYADPHDEYRQLLEDEVGLRSAALVESEARYRRIVETANEGVLEIDVDGRTRFVNARMAEMLGYDATELIGRAPTDHLDREGASQLLADFETMKRGARRAQAEVRFRRKDGATLWALLEASPVLDSAGRFDGVLVMAMDVTARKETEEAQREAELRFKRLFESGIIGVAVTGTSGAVTEANPTFLDMLGYSREDLAAGRLSWRALTPVEWQAKVVAGEEPERRRSAAPAEKEYLRKDGGRVPVLVGAAALDESRAITVVTDLTALKRVERTLLDRMRLAALGAEVGAALASGDSLREILQRCAEAVVTNLDAALVRIWTFSGSPERLELEASAGLPMDNEAHGAPVFDVERVALERVPHVSHDLGNDPYVLDPARARRKGLRALAGYPLIVDGELVGVVMVSAREPIRDDALKGLGATADAIAVRIRGKLAEQANKRLEEQLRQSQKMEAVGRLAGGVAHDFNNLLSVVLTYAELAIGERDPSDPIRSDIEEIHHAGLRAADLTRQLLLFSRQQVVEPRVLDLNEVLSSMDKMLQRIVGEDVQITARQGRSLGRVRVDPGSIEQVIMNLVINARDAMPIGGRITMQTANVDLDEDFVAVHLGTRIGRHVMLSVTDTGTGMDAATMARIFEPFFTTKAQGKGTGLGLSTVFGIAQQSGGTVWVESQPGVGTTFEVYLPEVEAVVEPRRPSRAPSTGRGTETVLLVEDEDQVRDVARGILRRSGYVVLEARNAEEALLLCERSSSTIDLLLSDVVMPGMSGPELAKRLVRGRPDMRVLCMSGYIDDAAVRHGVVDAHFAYLQKPITVDGLTRKVREVLDAKGTCASGSSFGSAE